MVCREVMDRLSPFLDDELDSVASREVSSHLASCASCAAALSAARRLGARYILRGLISSQAVPSIIAAVNTVTVSFAFTLTGARANHVCVRVASGGAPPRSVPHPRDDGVACVTVRPE